jgi:hypothetical protein
LGGDIGMQVLLTPFCQGEVRVSLPPAHKRRGTQARTQLHAHTQSTQTPHGAGRRRRRCLSCGRDVGAEHASRGPKGVSSSTCLDHTTRTQALDKRDEGVMAWLCRL